MSLPGFGENKMVKMVGNFEVGDDGKLTMFIAFDDTLSMFNAMKK